MYRTPDSSSHKLLGMGPPSIAQSLRLCSQMAPHSTQGSTWTQGEFPVYDDHLAGALQCGTRYTQMSELWPGGPAGGSLSLAVPHPRPPSRELAKSPLICTDEPKYTWWEVRLAGSTWREVPGGKYLVGSISSPHLPALPPVTLSSQIPKPPEYLSQM